MTPSRSKRVRIYQSSYRQQTAPVATMPPHDYEGCRAVGNYAQPGHHIDCPHLWILQQAFRQHTMICETDYLFYCMSTLKEGKINMFLLKHSFFYNIPCGCFYMSTTSSSPVYLDGITVAMVLWCTWLYFDQVIFPPPTLPPPNLAPAPSNVHDTFLSQSFIFVSVRVWISHILYIYLIYMHLIQSTPSTFL